MYLKNNKGSAHRSIAKGFTLIELLVVVAIISLLTSVVLASLNTARAKARDAERKSTIRQLQIALELYYSKNGQYPGGIYSTTGYGSDMIAMPNVFAPEFMPRVPLDPKNLNGQYGYYYARDFKVTASDCPGATSTDYILGTRLETSSRTGLSCWNNGGINYIVGNTSEYR